MTRVLVTGGRTYRDQGRVDDALDQVHAATPISLLIHGAARGADSLAHDWARRRGVEISQYPADWDNLDRPGARIRWNSCLRKFYDATAGFRRNRQMLVEGCPELVVAFPGGSGTANMVALALRGDVAVLSVDP